MDTLNARGKKIGHEIVKRRKLEEIDLIFIDISTK